MDPLMTGFCPPPDAWRQFVLGRLEPGQVDALETHLVQCSVCLPIVASLESGDESVRALQARLAKTPDPECVSSLVRRVQQLYLDSPPDRTTADLPAAPRDDGSGLPSVPGYTIEAELGRGGMGVVFRAVHQRLKCVVALKMILAHERALDHETARFLSEAEMVARLRHPNIVHIYEVGEYQGKPYLTLELVEGGSLAERIAGTPQDPLQAAALLETLARAMHHAHEQGVVHRDLKPANVLLSSARARSVSDGSAQPVANAPGSDFTPKITDFGLAKKLDQPGQTTSGAIVGTPSYMSPEQANGQRDVGPAADVYALGTVLYELLTGRPPFLAATTYETIRQVLKDEPIPPRRSQPTVPCDLETVCLKCLRKEAGKRYASAAALADDLRRFLDHRPILARPTPAWERAWMWARRQPARAALVALCTSVVLTAAVGYVLFRQQQSVADQKEATRLADLRDVVDERLRAGQEQLARQNWKQAELELSLALNAVKEEPTLAALHERAKRLLDEADAELRQNDRRAKAVRHFEEFTDRLNRARNDAIGAVSLDAGGQGKAAQAARSALALVQQIPEGLNAAEQDVVTSGHYELLLTLAGLVDDAGEGLRLLDQAAKLRPPGRAWRQSRAALLLRQGGREAAREELRLAEKTEPAGSLDHFLTGQLLFHARDSRAAMEQFQAALRLQPDHFWANFTLALCCFRERRLEQALASLSECQKSHPNLSPWTCIYRGLVHGLLGARARAAGQEPSARDHFRRADEDFRLAEAMPLTADARYALANHRAVTLVGRKEPARAVPVLRSAIALNPEPSFAYVNLAEAFSDLGQLDDALEQLGKAIARQPRQADLLRRRGDLQRKRAERDEGLAAVVPMLGLPFRGFDPARAREAALDDYARAITLYELAPPAQVAEDLAAAYAARGQVFAHLRRADEALDAFDRALALLPNLAAAHLGRAGLLMASKPRRYDEAVRAFDAYLKHGGRRTADIYDARGVAQAGQRRFAAALSDASRAVELAPRDARLHARRGWLYVIIDQPALALADFRHTLDLAPKDADALAGRGFVLATLGKYREAMLDGEAVIGSGASINNELGYKLARLYAQSAKAARAAAERNNPQRAVVARCQDQAMEMLRLALNGLQAAERRAFWRETVETDVVLLPLRGHKEYERLAREYGAQRREAMDRGLRPQEGGQRWVRRAKEVDLWLAASVSAVGNQRAKVWPHRATGPTVPTLGGPSPRSATISLNPTRCDPCRWSV